MSAARFMMVAILAVVLLLPAGAEANHWLNATDYKLKGAVKSIMEQQVLLGENGKETVVPLRTVHYDASGKATREIIYRGTGSYTDRGYLYDSLGRLVSSGSYSPDGRFVQEVTYVYDEDGRLAVNHYYSADGSVFLSKEYKYDDAGELAEELQTAGGKLLATKKYVTDYNKNEQVVYIYGPDGRLLATENRKKYEDGTSDQEWHYYGGLSSYGPRQSNVSVKDGTVSTVCHLPDGSRYKYKVCDIQEGNGIRRIVHRADGSPMIELEYDAAGNILVAKKYHTDGRLEKAEKYVYQYDEKGNWTGRVSFVRTGNSDEWASTGEVRRMLSYYE